MLESSNFTLIELMIRCCLTTTSFAKIDVQVRIVCFCYDCGFNLSWFCGLDLGIASEIAPSIGGVEVEYVEVSALPFLNTDLEANGVYPSPVEAFRRKIVTAHAVLFASPDYNYSLSGTVITCLIAYLCWFLSCFELVLLTKKLVWIHHYLYDYDFLE